MAPAPGVSFFARTLRVPVVGLGGTAGAVLVAVSGGRLAHRPGQVPPVGWWGLLDPVGSPAHAAALAGILLVGVALLVATWLAGCVLARRGQLGLRAAVLVVASWGGVLAVAPPVLSLDVFSYVAQGQLLTLGFDPYRDAPAALPSGAVLAAVDPVWRGTHSPYGPVVGVLEHAISAVTGGNATWGAAVFGAVAVGCVALTATFAIRATAPGRRPFVAFAVCNPLVLLHLVGGAHLEAAMMLLVVGGLLACRRGWPILGLVLLSAAALVKWPAALALVGVLVALVWRQGVARRGALAVAGVAAAVVGVVPDGLGWVAAAATPTAGLTLYAPSSALAEFLALVLGALNVDVPFRALLHATRLAAMAVAAGGIFALLASADRRSVAATAGWAALVLALLGPVLYPWYLTWGLLPLALVGAAWADRALLALPAVGAFIALPGLDAVFSWQPGLQPLLRHTGPAVTAVLTTLALIGIIMATSPGRSRGEPALGGFGRTDEPSGYR